MVKDRIRMMTHCTSDDWKTGSGSESIYQHGA